MKISFKIKNRTVEVIVRIAAYLTVLLLLHFFVARPLVFGKLDKAAAEYSEVQKELTGIEFLIKANPNPKKKLQEIENKMEDFKKKAVSEEELPRVIQQITKKSSELRIEIISIKPLKNVSFSEGSVPRGVSKAYLEVVLRAPYKVLGDYLKSLDELSIIFTIESLSVTGPREPEALGQAVAAAERGEVTAVIILSSYTVWKL